MNTAIKDVDAYLATLPDEDREVLQQLRQIIRATAPDATEGIGYGMPLYKYYGMLVGFAAAKTHYGFYPGGTVARFEADLKNYSTSKGTIRLPKDKPLPVTLIKKIIKERMKENALKHEAKVRAKAAK